VITVIDGAFSEIVRTRPVDDLGHLSEDVHPCFARASFSATSMISSVMPEILMSICRAVTPFAVPATLKSMSPR
jgi:hypothetical protein